MKKAGYGIRGEASLLTKYEADWQHVGSMCILGQCLYKSHFQGIDEISLSSLTRVLEIRRGVSCISLSPSIVSCRTGILYADPKSHRCSVGGKNSNEGDVFAVTSSAGNMDEMAARTECYQSVYLCVEFGHVVYVCDAQLNCIMISTLLKQTAEFFNASGKIYKAFFVHEKHQAYRLSGIREASWSATLFSYCAGMKLLSKARLPIYP